MELSGSPSKASRRASQGKPARTKVKKHLSTADVKERRKSLTDASHLIAKMRDSGAVSDDETFVKKARVNRGSLTSTLSPVTHTSLKFDAGCPVVKGGTVQDLALWLIDCGGTRSVEHFPTQNTLFSIIFWHYLLVYDGNSLATVWTT